MSKETGLKLGMFSLVGRSTAIPMFFAPTRWYAGIAKEAGISGLEFWPTRMTSFQVNRGSLSAAEIETIDRAHQSFRSENNLLQSVGHENRAFAVGSFLLLPHRDTSINTLERLAKITGNLATVVYPETPQKVFQKATHLTNKLVQPTQKIAQDWKITTIEEFLEELEQRGFQGVCLDTHHFRNGDDMFSVPENLERLIEKTQEVHVSVGRVDEEIPGIDTMAELRDILFDKRETNIFPILEGIRRSGFRGPFVLEIPLLSIEMALGKRFLRRREIVEQYKRAAENIGNALALAA